MVLLAVCDKELIEKCLKDVGVCQRCCLRFTGERYAKVYQNTDNCTEDVAKRPRPNSCVACLGLLQDQIMLPFLDQVAGTINTSGYDAQVFSLSLSIPMCIFIRQHALMVHLRKSLPASCISGLKAEHVVSIKQVWKYIYPDHVAGKVELEYQPDDTSFIAEVQAEWSQESGELECMEHICPQEYATRAKNIHVYNMGVYSRVGIEKSLCNTDDKEFAVHYPVPPTVPTGDITVTTKLIRASCYIGGRYCKYSRELPQTPWFINNERKCETSVEELLADCINGHVKATELKFLASGREDVDVRMLGSGRPFAIECCNPLTTKLSEEQMKTLENEFNKKELDISVHSLKIVSKNDIKNLKEGEEEKRKSYTALCVTSQPVHRDKFLELEKLVDLKLEQLTPIRVLHRRANAMRSKIIHKMSFSSDGLQGNMFRMNVETSAGTYVKEFVHGDFNRTKPCLRSLLGVDTDILALDVMEVHLPWPPNNTL